MAENVTIVGTIATTRYIEKYKAYLDPRVLEEMKQAILAGQFPLQLQHDSFRPWMRQSRGFGLKMQTTVRRS